MPSRKASRLFPNALALCCLLALMQPIPVFAQAGANTSQAITYRIAAGPLDTALNQFSTQSNLQVVYSPELVAGKTTTGLSGQFAPQEALKRLLQGTGLGWNAVNDSMYVLKRSGNTPEPTKTSPKSTKAVETKEEVAELEAVVVTGTNIRGATPAGAQVVILDREDIDRGGFSTAAQAVRSLPQNFNGGVQSNPTSGRDPSNLLGQTNSTQGDAIDIRGLGADSTLVLLDGRRLAPSGTSGAFTDVSSLPLTAIERIEVLPDGASALYGSDAVGGVVNFILRRDFEGAETTVRTGATTSGHQNEVQVGQAFGTQWPTGSVLVSGELFHRDNLKARSRSRMSSDLTRFGGTNFDVNTCNPGTLIVAGQTYAIPANQDGTDLDAANLVAGTANLCDRNYYADLFPELHRLNILGMVRQEIGNGLSVFMDAFYSRRKTRSSAANFQTITVPSTNAFYVNPAGGTEPVSVAYDFGPDLGPLRARSTINSHNIVAGVTWEPDDAWSITAYTGPAREAQRQDTTLAPDAAALAEALASSDPATAFNPFGDGSNTSADVLDRLRDTQVSKYAVESKLWTSNVTADGTLFQLPGGDLKVAVGAEQRDEEFASVLKTLNLRSGTEVVNADDRFDRRVGSLFAEASIPLFGSENRRPGLQRLILSIAGRYEHANDFGDSFVPRFGLSWNPEQNLTVRASWARSYKAPNLVDLFGPNSGSFITPLPDQTAPNGLSTALLVFGSNSSLRPQTATSWTTGVDFKPSRRSRFSLTYFALDFEDRIGLLPSGDYLGDPANASAVNRDPTGEERSEFCAIGTFFGNLSSNPGGCLDASIDAIIDTRISNLARTEESGIDLSGEHFIDTAKGAIGFQVSATYLLKYLQQTAPDVDSIDSVNTANRPLRFKGRGSVSWTRDPFSTALFVNYTNGYRSSLLPSSERISSWTTIDVNVAYRLDAATSKVLNGLEASLHIQNIFDSEAPFYNNPLGVGYDPANASLQGRMLSLSLRGEW